MYGLKKDKVLRQTIYILCKNRQAQADTYTQMTKDFSLLYKRIRGGKWGKRKLGDKKTLLKLDLEVSPYCTTKASKLILAIREGKRKFVMCEE